MGLIEDAMPRPTLPLAIEDLSTFTKSLQAQIAETPAPGHLSLMNMLARAAGFRNLQHLQASAKAEATLARPAPRQPDLTRVAQALRFFDAQGRLTSWPSRTNIQHLCLWALWSRLPRGESLTERQISDHLNRWHLFGDAAILRRTLWELKLISRSPDCRDYRRIDQPPPPEAVALIRQLHGPQA